MFVGRKSKKCTAGIVFKYQWRSGPKTAWSIALMHKTKVKIHATENHGLRPRSDERHQETVIAYNQQKRVTISEGVNNILGAYFSSGNVQWCRLRSVETIALAEG